MILLWQRDGLVVDDERSGEDRALIGAESLTTIQALAPSANPAVVIFGRVDNLGISFLTIWTFHDVFPSNPIYWGGFL